MPITEYIRSLFLPARGVVTFSSIVVERTAKLFEVGEYPDKGITVSNTDLDRTVGQFTAPVNIKVEHKDSPFDGEVGNVQSIFRRGNELWGKVQLPDNVWSIMRSKGRRGISVGLDRNTLALNEVSWTNKPRIPSAMVFSTTESEYLFSGEVFADQRDKGLPSRKNEDIDGEDEGTKASGQSVVDLLKLLTDVLDFTLPSDTTGDNFVERAVTALTAIRGVEDEKPEVDGTIKEPPKKAKEQPGPVAMSKELEFAVGLLKQGQLKNPITGQAYTLDEITTLAAKKDAPTVNVQMSEADQASVNWARKSMLSTYKARIEACVKSGRIPADSANEIWSTMEEASGNGTLQFSFDAEGNQQKTQFDHILDAWERTPANLVMTGQSPTAAAKKTQLLNGSAAFSLTGGTVEQPSPEFSDPLADDAALSDEQADNILAIQWANSGKPMSQVDGGYQVPASQ